MLPYSEDLASAIIDLLQVETVPSRKDNDTAEQATMDSDPTSTNSKFPPFRRAALHFLSLFFRETTKQVYESGSILPDIFIRRAKIVLSYVASTDQDAVVRIMAREASEGLEQIKLAMIGL